jgi:sensor histidine kinase YesM
VLSVRDNGRGLHRGWSADRLGVGLGNTLERLDSLYGDRYRFSIEPGPGGGTLAELTLPLD